jgi:WD40 repeat protein
MPAEVTGDGGGVNAVCRSSGGKLLVAGCGAAGGSSFLKLFQYPCLLNAEPFVYSGHGSAVVDVSFSYDDLWVISVGGLDDCVFVWECK